MARRSLLIYLGLSLVLLAVVSMAVALSPRGDEQAVPAPLNSVRPAPGSADILQATIRVDIEVGYEIALAVDGVVVPQSEIEFIAGVGRFEWNRDRSQAFGPWEPGTHTVEVTWDTVAGLPDRGSFAWSFRIQ